MRTAGKPEGAFLACRLAGLSLRVRLSRELHHVAGPLLAGSDLAQSPIPGGERGLDPIIEASLCIMPDQGSLSLAAALVANRRGDCVERDAHLVHYADDGAAQIMRGEVGDRQAAGIQGIADVE